MRYYLASLRKENYEILKNIEFSIIGFNNKSLIADEMEPGDVIIIYIGSRVSKIAGIVEVTGKCKWNTELIWDDIFPKRIPIKPIIILDDEKMINIRDLLDGIKFVKNKEKYGVYFFSGVKHLSKEDGNYIKKSIEKANKERNGK